MAKKKSAEISPEEFDALVSQRVRDSLGALSREDAVEVVKAQLAHDAAIADSESDSEPKK